MRSEHRTTASDPKARAATLAALAAVTLTACAMTDPAVHATAEPPRDPWTHAPVALTGARHELEGLDAGRRLRVLGRATGVKNAELCGSHATNLGRILVAEWTERFAESAMDAWRAEAAPVPRGGEQGSACLGGRVTLWGHVTSQAVLRGTARDDGTQTCLAWLELDVEDALRSGAKLGADEATFVTWLFTGTPRPFDRHAAHATEHIQAAGARGTLTRAP